MSLKHKWLLPLFLVITTSKAAEQVTEYILDTVDSGDGSWPCLFYELNYNSDISQAEKAKWYSLDEDESYWREGVGPFSIDANKFLVTQWQSTVHPILIRRHFTLTAEDMAKIQIGVVTFTYSYDENPKFWLNGKQLVSASGWNDNNYATLLFNSTRKKYFVEGDNVLCVSLQQGGGGGHIDYGLSVRYNPMHDGLSAPDSDSEDNAEIYNLTGQRISYPAGYRGIIITKGKKIIQKY